MLKKTPGLPAINSKPLVSWHLGPAQLGPAQHNTTPSPLQQSGTTIKRLSQGFIVFPCALLILLVPALMTIFIYYPTSDGPCYARVVSEREAKLVCDKLCWVDTTGEAKRSCRPAPARWKRAANVVLPVYPTQMCR